MTRTGCAGSIHIVISYCSLEFVPFLRKSCVVGANYATRSASVSLKEIKNIPSAAPYIARVLSSLTRPSMIARTDAPS